jgi:hypothetical protein
MTPDKRPKRLFDEIGNYIGPEEREPCPFMCSKPEEAADKVLKKTFAIFGVDIEKPEQVEKFRQDLRFGGTMHRFADRGMMATITVIAGVIVTALGYGLVIIAMDIAAKAKFLK